LLVGSRDDLAKSESCTVEGYEGLDFAKQLAWGQWTKGLLQLWEATQPSIQQPHYLHRFCDNCEESICTFNSSQTILCYRCLSTIQKENEIYKDQTRTREGDDDEQEFMFTGILIAGKNEGDKDEDWASDDSEQEEEVCGPGFTSIKPCEC
jgi:hypothetical protein